MENKIAIFDIDGTIFRKNLHFELIDELAWLKIFPRSVRKKLIELYTNWLEHKGTYESFRKALIALYAEHIKGCHKSDVLKASKIVVPFYKDRTYIFTEELIKKLKKENYHIIAISGSPIEIVEEFNRDKLRFDKVFGSVYEIDRDNVYTGRVIFEPVRDKGQLVRQYVSENNLSLKESCGVGDTESDTSFLKLVDRAVAFNPNQNLKEIAEKEGWEIIVEKKDVIYEIKNN
jgi:HAD superfamily hydrolase (TIGR01490 family)